MADYDIRLVGSVKTRDDKPPAVVRRDLSGGANTRQDAANINENQASIIENGDIGIEGQVVKFPGITLVEDLTGTGVNLFGFEPDGGTNELYSVILSGSNVLQYYTGSGSFSTVSGAFGSGATPLMGKLYKSGGDGDVLIFSDGEADFVEVDQSHTATTLTDDGVDAPPKGSNVFTSYRGRLWILLNNKLYWSDAYPSDLETAFTQATNAFNVPCGTQRFLLGTREQGLVCGGKDEIWSVNPSMTPVATDKVELLVTEGCVAGRTACLVGDDIYYLAKDGVRGVFKTQFDKMQYRTSFPLSYALKDEFESINWAYINKACAAYFDNKYILSLPVDSSTYNNELWIYYPASDGWVIYKGVTIAGLSTVQISGEDRLYGIDATDGKVYRMFYGSDLNGSDFTYTEEGRKEDLGYPMLQKTGGEVLIKVKATAEHDISVFASFDEGDYNLLGHVITEDRLTNFASWALPLIFQNSGVYVEKFHLDEFGEWYQIKLKITETGAGGADLKFLERGIVAFLNEYITEE